MFQMTPFPIGSIVITQLARERLTRQEIFQALAKHARCEWYELSENDRGENERAVKVGGTILTPYHSRSGKAFLVITYTGKNETFLTA